MKLVLIAIAFLCYTLKLGHLKGCRVMKLNLCRLNQNLTGHVITIHQVINDSLCAIKCYIEKKCVSYNLGPMVSGVLYRTCFLSQSDHVLHPGDLQNGSTYEYCSFQNPCSSNPCSSGQCRPDKTFTTYSCKCATPLGMQSGAIPNDSITASSYWGPGHEPFLGRLHFQKHPKEITNVNAGVWASRKNKEGQYLQVDLGNTNWVSMVATQGRESVYHHQWVTSYTLGYSNDGMTYKLYKTSASDAVKVFKGNIDGTTVVKNELQPVIKARLIRFVAKTWHRHISMRTEIYGCSV